jgi:hypothetical protein
MIYKEVLNVTLKLGTAKVNITPKVPVHLAGFAHREGTYASVEKDLYLRAFYFQQYKKEGNFEAVLITADLIWWGADLVAEIEKELYEKNGIPIGSTVFHATHNHSGPQTASGFTSHLGKCNSEYLKYLVDQVVLAIQKAMETVEIVEIERTSSSCNIGINRRKIIEENVLMAPNPNGVIDKELIVIKFMNRSEQLKAVLFHYACHPTTTGDNFISSEFPGAASERIEQEFNENIVAGYLQGCCGDIRPNLTRDENFYRGDQDDVDRFGLRLANQGMDCYKKKNWEKVIPTHVKITKFSLLLDFDISPSEQSLNSYNDSLIQEWRQKQQLKDPKKRSLEFTMLSIGKNLTFLGMNAEMVVEYGIYIKNTLNGKVIPIPYTNGMIGYVSTEKQLKEGGYESQESIYYFALAAPFVNSTEHRIKQEIKQLERRLNTHDC